MSQRCGVKWAILDHAFKKSYYFAVPALNKGGTMYDQARINSLIYGGLAIYFAVVTLANTYDIAKMWANGRLKNALLDWRRFGLAIVATYAFPVILVMRAVAPRSLPVIRR
jgi:hypothetical protein